MADFFENYGFSNSQSTNKPPTSSDKSSELFDDYPEVVLPVINAESKKETSPDETQKMVEVEKEVDALSDESTQDIDSLYKELEEMIGLNRVKFEIQRLLHFVKIRNLRLLHGISKSPISLHSVYYGSPGTGKTTVARLYGKMLKAMGILSKGHLVETDRAGLVGSYVGQTTNKTDEKIKEALGGILFIDEAYALSKGEEAKWDYGTEAIEILVKRMEDHRDDLVVIVAGYPEPMQKFISSNEGLRSRFSTFIHFDDYTPDEMIKIFEIFCNQENYRLTEESLGLVATTIEYHYSHRDKSFGNARFVRNLFELIIRNHAFRVATSSKTPTIMELQVILPEDVPLVTGDVI